MLQLLLFTSAGDNGEDCDRQSPKVGSNLAAQGDNVNNDVIYTDLTNTHTRFRTISTN